MRIGRYRLSSLPAGHLALDGGAMFGVVPKALWERVAPADAQNRVRVALRALLVEEVDGPGRIVVDTGAGDKWSADEAARYGVDPRPGLAMALAARGLAPADVTDVLLTHLHFDHAGGATTRRGGRVVPTFPNARYWVQRRNLAWARAPSEKDRASYRAENFEPLLEHGVLELLDGEGAWRDGIELLVSEGHTTAMQLPKIEGAGGTLLYGADLVPTAAHLPLPWVMSYDNQPLVSIAEKKDLLGQAAAQGWVLFFEHDVEGPAARIEAHGSGYRVAERMEL